MDFASFLANIYDGLTGSTSVVEQHGTQTLPDGTVIPNLVVVAKKNPNVNPICGETGALYILHHIQLVMNRHTALGELGKDEIAQIAGETIMRAVDTMMFNMAEYGVRDTTKLEAEGLNLEQTLYIYLTGLKEGGIRTWIGGMNTVSVVRTETNAQPKVLGG
jgi:hypothetical protein